MDKFESQFYEMLRLDKENVNEMSVEGYDYTDAVTDDAFKVYNILRNDINEKGSKHKPNQDTNRKEIVGRKIFFFDGKGVPCYILHFEKSLSPAIKS